jgi:hypothetical protein
MRTRNAASAPAVFAAGILALAAAGTAAAQVSFFPPSPATPAFHADIPLDASWAGAAVESVHAGDRELRDFRVWNGGEEAVDRVARAGVGRVVACVEWAAGEKFEFRIAGKKADGGALEAKVAAQAPATPGTWLPGWKHSVGIVLTERYGLRRVKEPVHLTLGLFAERLTDPAREIRVVGAAADGKPVEVPCQVGAVSTWDRRELIDHPEKDEKTGAPVIRYHATTTVEVAFLADVEPKASRVYLVCYGNPDAPAPAPETDLKVTGAAPGRSVENAHYRVDLDGKSGQITGILLRERPGEPLEHKLETNGAVHWNPDLYAPPHAWVHVSDWERPAYGESAGPVCLVTRRSAPLPHLPKTHAAVTYRFYAGVPWFEVETLLEIGEDIDLQSLRNGEIVFNRKVLDEFAWRDRDGALRTLALAKARPHPEHAVEVPPDVSWLAFLSRGKGVGFAGIPVAFDAFNRSGGTARLEQPYFYVACGPWFYWSRALVYAFGSNNPTRMIRVPAGSVYRERTAYLPFKAGGDDAACFAAVDAAQQALATPLAVRTWQPTDPRIPKQWVIPILTEPFEEGVEGSLGGKEKK